MSRDGRQVELRDRLREQRTASSEQGTKTAQLIANTSTAQRAAEEKQSAVEEKQSALEARIESFVAEGGAGAAAAMESQEQRLREEAEEAAAARVRRIEQTVARGVAKMRLGAQSKAWETWVGRVALARRRQNLLRKTAGRMRSLELSRHFRPWAVLARDAHTLKLREAEAAGAKAAQAALEAQVPQDARRARGMPQRDAVLK